MESNPLAKKRELGRKHNANAASKPAAKNGAKRNCPATRHTNHAKASANGAKENVQRVKAIGSKALFECSTVLSISCHTPVTVQAEMMPTTA